jgi:hypothetical protein
MATFDCIPYVSFAYTCMPHRSRGDSIFNTVVTKAGGINHPICSDSTGQINGNAKCHHQNWPISKFFRTA